MIPKRLKFFICSLIFCSAVYAQVSEGNFTIEKPLDYDTSYIHSQTDKLGLYVYSIRKFRNYELKNKTLNQKLKFEPNGQSNLGLGFNYKWMGIGMAFSFPFMNRDNDVYGETSRFDLQLNIFSRFYGISAYYQNYKGFYLSNPDDFQISNFEHYPYLKDLQSSSLGISAYYFFNNRKFSYKAAFVRNEVQRKSAGGFILGAFFDLNVVYTPSGFIPVELPDSLNQSYDFNGYSTSVTGISFGYTYTLIFFKSAFFNLSFVPGIGYRNLTIWRNTGNEDTNPSFSGSLVLRMSLGNEGKRFYYGVSAIVSVESFKYESVDISSSTGQVRIYFGKRFNFGKRKKKSG